MLGKLPLTRGSRQALAILLSCCFPATAGAQAVPGPLAETIAIAGEVRDSTSELRLDRVTVEIRSKWYGHIATTITDTLGAYRFPRLPKMHSYELILTGVGHDTKTLHLAPSGSETTLPPIYLATQYILLDEIQVTETKPLLQMEEGKIIYNVDADPESASASVFDILRKIPFLQIDADDNIRLQGSGNFRVLVNGRPSSLFVRNRDEVFKSFPASSIKSIEIIQSPPLQYGAMDGSGILNIITRDKLRGGVAGSLSVTGATPEAHSTALSLSSSRETVDLSADISHTRTTIPGVRSLLQRTDKVNGGTLGQSNVSTSESDTWNWGTEFGLRPGDLSTLTFAQSLNRTTGSSNDASSAHMIPMGGPAKAYGSQNENASTATGGDASVEFTVHAAEAPLRHLRAFVSWTHSRADDQDHLQPMTEGRESHSGNKDRFSEWSGQLDCSQPLGRFLVEAGGSGLLRNNRSQSAYRYRDSALAPFIVDNSQAYDFEYAEQVYGAYLSLKLAQDKWTLRVGSRLEAAHLNARFVSAGTEARNSYTSLLPNILVSLQTGKLSSLSLSYVASRQRPPVFYLNPYVHNEDPLTISFGNPGLRPERTGLWLAQFQTLLHKTALFVNLTNRSSQGSVQPITRLGSDRISRSSYENIGSSQLFLLSAGCTLPVNKGINLGMNAEGQCSSFQTEPGRIQSGTSYGLGINGNMWWKDWRGNFNGSYHAAGVQAQGRSGSYFNSSVSIRKTFLPSKRIILGFTVANPFSRYRVTTSELDDATFHISREASREIRRFQLSLQYRFSKLDL